MKIAYFSDPHVNGDPTWFPIFDSDTDLILCAGDIHINHHLAYDFLKRLHDSYHVPVVAVLGNHDYESASRGTILNDIRQWNSQQSGVTILENDVFSLNGVDIFGATLWSNTELYGLTESYFAQQAIRKIQDFMFLHEDNGPILVRHMIDMSRASAEWLSNAIQQSSAHHKILMTHFSPHPTAIQASFGRQPLNAYFANDYPSLYGYVDTILHGHTHRSYEETLPHGTTIMCNARGHKSHKLNPDFDIRYFHVPPLTPSPEW